MRRPSLPSLAVAVGLLAVLGVVLVVHFRGHDEEAAHAPAGTTTATATTPSPSTTTTSSTTVKPPPPPPSARRDFPLPVPTRNVWHTYVVDLVLGRTDGTTARPGSLRVWVDGADTPAIDVDGVDTLQRADGQTQRWMQLWDGDYTQDLETVASQEFALTRVGRTLNAALLDRPKLYDTTAADQRYRGEGYDGGAPSLTPVAAVSATDAKVPESLGGNTSPQGPIPTYRVTLTPNWVSTNDSLSSNYQSVWAYSRSPTTPWRSPDSLHQVGRYLLVDPRSTDADGRRGTDEIWLVIQRRWPAAFDPGDHGRWGTLVNLHSVGGDVGWESGSGVSSVAMVWQPHAATPAFHLEYNGPG